MAAEKMDLIAVNKFKLEIKRRFLRIRRQSSGRESPKGRKLSFKMGLDSFVKGICGTWLLAIAKFIV